jgi:hypothetical protein
MKDFKRPDLKLPEVKVPGFLGDLVNDLRDRHLLPLVGLLLIAIVVVPFALKSSGGSDSGGEGAGAAASGDGVGTAGGAPQATAFTGSLTGLRDYRRRLRNLTAKDPFKQQYAGAAAAASGAAASTGVPAPASPSGPAPSAGTADLPSSTPAASGGSSGADGGSAGGDGGSPVKVETRYASYEIDVRIVGAGSGGGGTASSTGTASAKGGVKVRRGLPELTMLPDRKHPAAIFMGVSPDSKKALLLVSSDVRAVFGDAHCIVGSRSCQLLALEPGLPETFVYGARGKTYRIELLKIHRVLSRHPRRASLGD